MVLSSFLLSLLVLPLSNNVYIFDVGTFFALRACAYTGRENDDVTQSITTTCVG